MERFMTLYETVYKDLYYLAFYYLGNQQDAEDAVGEAVLNAYENFASLRKKEAFRGWIIRILVNQCKLQQRKSGIQKAAELITEPSYHPKLEDSLVTSELLQKLSDEERMIVVLSVFGGYKGEEIARILNLGHSTVRSKYRRALKKLEQSILDFVKSDIHNLDIPESITPEQMRKMLEEHQAGVKDDNRPDTNTLPDMKKKKRLTFSKALAVAASVCVVIGCAVMAERNGLFNRFSENAVDKIGEDSVNATEDVVENADALDDAGTNLTYEKIYASMEKVWQEEEQWRSYDYGVDVTDGVVMEEAGEMEVPAADMVENTKESNSSDSIEKSFGSTNIQTVGVDEGDIVKNDGRYLYQSVNDDRGEQFIQIVDTQDGLKELACLEGFQSINEFYVWDDLLVVIENKYLEPSVTESSGSIIACYDVLYHENCYHQISIYDITDRSVPSVVKVFTLQGSYMSSRIADGYFYGFSRYYANPGEGEEDYDAYVPTLDGARLDAKKIVLPKECEGTSYLVMVSVDLRNPSDFVDTMGIVSDSDQYYVSSNNIYMAYSAYKSAEEGWSSNETTILRFSYDAGEIELEAEGSIKGYLNNTFSMDEYEDYLRVVTTVQENNYQSVTDDRTGEVIGMGVTDSRQTNALYVLDKSLTVVGSIEGLAEDEQIYSARFMGDTGYFVTFRQTDPLFAVDLTEPTNPVILSELKVSGFSEYLHFYGENRLFGLGMEADEETGRQEGIKLSMFDISDPGNVQEVTRLHMKEYYYSEALYNHHAVLIHPTVNIIGFSVEGNRENEYVQEYLVFAYENDSFVQKLKIDTKDDEGRYYTTRGTFIDDTFYLLSGDGSVESYDLNTGAALERLDGRIGE